MEVVHELPGVGANLSDHFAVRVTHRVKDEVSVNQLARGLRLAGEIGRFAVTGRGALTFGVTTAMVFCRSREGLDSPDLQLLFTPGSYDPNGIGRLEREPGMTIVVCIARPDSRGMIMARSSDPFAPPAIRPNYLSAQSDSRALLAGIEHARRIFAAQPLAKHSVGRPCPVPTSDRKTHSSISCTGPARTFIIRSGPAGWARIPRPSSTCGYGSEGWQVCGSSTPRSCRP